MGQRFSTRPSGVAASSNDGLSARSLVHGAAHAHPRGSLGAHKPLFITSTFVEVSTVIRGIAAEVPLGAKDGLPKKCVANADNVVTIPKRWLESRICGLTPQKLAAVDEALRFAFDLSKDRP
jgi:hypothetical protein